MTAHAQVGILDAGLAGLLLSRLLARAEIDSVVLGAKGMNLAVADVRALVDFHAGGREERPAAYSQHCLARAWRAEHFSWWMTSMLHRFPHDDAFGHRRQRSQLRCVTSSPAAATSLAGNYVGLPFAN